MDDRSIQKVISDLKRNNLSSDMELLQILKMLAGYKYSVRLMYRQRRRLDKVIAILAGNGVPCVLADRTAGTAVRDRGKGGWANLCRPGRKDREYSLYAGRSARAVREASDAEMRQDDRKFGNTLGYPECCSEFFNAEFPRAAGI